MFDRTVVSAHQGGVVIGGDNFGWVNTGTINGDVVIVEGKPYRCNLYIPFEPKLDDPSDTKLLHWSSRLPRQLLGREAELETLLAWANSPAPLSLAVIEGSAGVGKTRLAFELADNLRQQAWQAGQVKDPAGKIAFPFSEQRLLHNLGELS
ncbi:MAG: hypothetical protein QM520_05120 [Gammaproteobacteria bacterium]|nr:hypothetical protein [Gammaproteobacteria bacterium]